MSSIKIQNLMQQSGVAFGTSGSRGLVTQMSDELCCAYTLAFIAVMQTAYPFARVALGIDLRPSSPAIAAACAAGINAAGLRVDYCGELPTPALALYAQQQAIPAIMVTGSHIPFDRNGIKFYRPDGEISKADELAITQSTISLPEAATIELPAINSDAMHAYIQRYLDFFPENLLNGLRIGLYEHSSVARDILKLILQQLGGEVISIGRTDIFVPIDTEAVSEADRQQGKQWASAYQLDSIISTDGDGDRPLLADEQGEWLRGDLVGLLTSQYLGIKQVALPVSCNTAIELCGFFDAIKRTRIGSPYVIAAMQEFSESAGAIAGFEANGGYLLGSTVSKAGKSLTPLATRDAVLPSLAILASAKSAGLTISALTKDLPARYTASDRLQDVPSQISQELFKQWRENIAALAEILAPLCGDLLDWNAIDGLRLIFLQGDIVHLRASGNAPELRCYSEAASADRAATLTQTVLELIKHRIMQAA